MNSTNWQGVVLVFSILFLEIINVFGIVIHGIDVLENTQFVLGAVFAYGIMMIFSQGEKK